MPDDDTRKNRLRFYGPGDYASYFQVNQVFDLLVAFDGERVDYDINDVVELSHAAVFVTSDFIPNTSTEAERQEVRGKLPDIHRVIGKFFGALNDTNFAVRIADIDFQYHSDVVNLLAKYKVLERCSPPSTLEALQAAGVNCTELLSCKPLVDLYDNEIRALLISQPRNAEILISKSLRSDQRTKIYLPKSFTSADSQSLLKAYIDSGDVNGNFLRLLATSYVNKAIGLDVKLKLKAKRRLEEYTKGFFNSNEGITTGVEVRISDDQVEEVRASLDGLNGTYSYRSTWLANNLDYPTILNNFIYLFQYVDDDMIMTLPAYYSQLGIFDRFMTTAGKEDYRSGAAFQFSDQASFLQLVMYRHFLELQGIELEDVVAWFAVGYLQQEFDAERLKFHASSATSSYLEKCRHIFPEMESILKQFTLYVQNGELDPELLAMTSEQLSYADIPSFLEGKYVYITINPDITEIQHLLFSDQSHICWINEKLSGENFLRLITNHQVTFDEFLEYQQPMIERLATFGIVDISGHVKFRNVSQALVLKGLFEHESVSYYHRPLDQQTAIDAMVDQGWLERRSSLLTTAEKSYVNYFLNQSEFSNGPDLRNRYLHGSQVDGEDARAHFSTYIIALRLLVLFAIKINDEFDLRDRQSVAANSDTANHDS